MKVVYNVNDFETLSIKDIKIVSESDYIDTHIGIKVEECFTVKGKPSIDFKEFIEIYEQDLKEAMELEEQLEISFEGYIEIDDCELKIIGYKYNSYKNKIELEVS